MPSRGDSSSPETMIIRKQFIICGTVQGVGFRPFVYRIASAHALTGWVLNDSRGVTIEVEGRTEQVEAFAVALFAELPPLARIDRCEVVEQSPLGETMFTIRASANVAARTAEISPDTFVCADCLHELFNPADRRYYYPFINCTNCGPRFTIVTGVPYDRALTTMRDFPLCPACRSEYEDPASRRFHAQPNACPVCGPQLRLHSAAGVELAGPLTTTIELLRAGKIVAIKGLGGYHLAVDAVNDVAVAELRRRKARDEKPLALMVADLPAAHAVARLDAAEEKLLGGVERPIVLLAQRADHGLSSLLAPRNNTFGLMLPYTPLHHLLFAAGFKALVMTSANLSDEPMAYRDDEARARLGSVADFFLSHNRAIHTRADDSIVRTMAGRALLLRRSRGYVPRSVVLAQTQPSVLALGAELKNTICLTRGDAAYLSQHIGDLSNEAACDGFEQAIAAFKTLLAVEPAIVAHDLHPDYYSTRFAEQLAGVELIAVQHHHAHLVSCMAENGVTAPTIGIICDGLGYGTDGTFWGGELLLGDCRDYRRLGYLRPLAMPGGDAASREPRRMALSALVAAYGDDLPDLPLLSSAFSGGELKLLRQMLVQGINAPLTSSCGRLFDAVAGLIGLRQVVSYEGQAALELEQAISGAENEGYSFTIITTESGMIFDSLPVIRAVVSDVLAKTPAGTISARFHNGLAELFVAACVQVRAAQGVKGVALSGGVFQNRYLTERTVVLLEAAGFEVLTHALVPPNDGGLALGQAVIAGAARGHSAQ